MRIFFERLQTNIQKEWVIILLLCVASIPAFATLFFKGYFPHHDDLQFMRIFELNKCFADGQIPCRWIPDMGYGFGYPLFNFYPPFPAYLGALIHFVTRLPIIDTVKVTFAAQILASTVLMYLFAKQWWGKLGGAVSAIVYLYSPYHAVDLYVRAAMNEAWAMAFAPGIGWALTRLSKKQSQGNVVLLALMVAGLLLSHNPMTLIFAPVLGIFALILIISQKSIRLLLSSIAGGAIGLGIAAFFTLPVVFEQKYVHIDSLTNGYFNYTQHFVTINQLFFSRYWGYGGSVYGIEDHMAFPLGYINWVAMVFAVFLLGWFISKRSFTRAAIAALFIGYFWLTAFMMHERSSVIIWSHVPVLQILQFPWRFLSTTTFCSSFFIGAFLLLPMKVNLKYIFASAIIIGVFALNVTFFRVEKRLPITDLDKVQGKLWELQRTASIFDYLPIYAVAPPGVEAPGDYQVMEGNPTITDVNKGSGSISMRVQSDSPSVIRLNIFDFPIWRVYLNGKEVDHNHDNYLALLTTTVPAGTYELSARFTNTPIRTIGNIVSVITVLGLAAWAAQQVFLRWKIMQEKGKKRGKRAA